MALNLEVIRRAVGLIEQIHKDMDFLEVNLSYLLGGSLCVPNCGLCCQQSFLIPTVSAQYIVLGIKRQPEAKQQLMTDKLERWVRYELPDVRMSFSSNGQNSESLMAHEYKIASSLWCPFLDEQKKCMIYPWRDINCRAWGISRPSGKICSRPHYESEENDAWSCISKDDGRLIEIRYQMAMLVGLLKAHQPSLLQMGWMPALIYKALEPEKWAEMLPKMQQIKSTGFNTKHTWLLTQEDVSEHALKEDVLLELSIPI